MIPALIHVLIIILVLGLAWWLLSYLPIPEPFGQIIRVILIIIAILVVVSVLWPLAGLTTVK
jgi:hypothetical protein